MKKLLIALIALAFMSCTYLPVDENSTISTGVQKELTTKTVPDTLYVVKTDANHYYFNSEKELIEKYQTDEDDVSTPYPALIFLIVALFFVGLLLGSAID